MNTAKTELVIFRARAQLAKTNISSIDVAGDVVDWSTVVKYVGAYLDEQLKLDKHATEKCKRQHIIFTILRKLGTCWQLMHVRL